MPIHDRRFIPRLPNAPCMALAWLAACAPANASPSAQAGIILTGTRIVFAAEHNEASIEIRNRGERPGLVQLWLDGPQQPEANGPGPASAPAAFVLTPALFRVEPARTQMVRIRYMGPPLPADRESLFWLHVQEIPPKAQTPTPGALRWATRTRIKLMYRPPGLPGRAHLAPAQLHWTLVTARDGTPALQAANPTAYVVNLGSVDLQAGDTAFEAGSGHVLPGETAAFPVAGHDGRALAGATVVFSSLNDWGTATRHEAPLLPP